MELKPGDRFEGQSGIIGSSRRIAREKLTVRTMIEMYCVGHHKSEPGTCEKCQMLYAYATCKLDKCPFQEAKPVCANYTIHWHEKVERAQIKEVTQFSGPRTLIRHPALSLLHMIDRLIALFGR
jgi:hypothetical protein